MIIIKKTNKITKIMKKILLILIILFSIWITYSNNNIENLIININWHEFDWKSVYLSIDKKITLKSHKNLFIKKEIYNNLINKIDSLKSKIWEYNSDKLLEILYYWLEKNIKEIEIYYSKVHKITLWYTKTGKEINAYYKWEPEKWYFWVFANIHWWYEYWTYNTALYLLDELNKSWKKWWFVIPTINPEWLEYYLNNTYNKSFFVNWRTNSNNVDINRNFCTKSFEFKTFIKNWEYIKTWIWWCNSENETKIIIDTLKKYKFNQIISLHSEWNIFFIPENSFDDEKIKLFWSELHKLLPSFDYDLSYNNNSQKEQKIYEYEIDEWWSKLYTGTMETYIYEKYNIPVILIELKKHWKTEFELKNLINYLK